MLRSTRDLVNSKLASTPSDPNVRPATPEPTTPSGVELERALYDLPPDDPRSAEHVSGRRQSRPTTSSEWYRNDRARQERSRQRGNRTRERKRSQSQSQSQPRHARVESPGSPNLGVAGQAPGGQSSIQPPPAARRRGRSTTVRELSRSPTPASTDHEPDPLPTDPQPIDSQYTYVYETLDHQGLVEFAQEKLNRDVSDCNTHTIIDMLRHAQNEQASQVGLARREASIVMLDGTPFGVGGGWHLASTALQPRGTKRTSGSLDGSAKRQRIATVDTDTATESETDEETQGRGKSPARAAAKDPPPESARSSQPGTQAPPPTRMAIPAAVPDIQPSARTSSSPRSVPPSVPQLPSITTPSRGPVHARLRNKLLSRYLEAADRDVEAASVSQAPVEVAQSQAPHLDQEPDGPEPSDLEEVPETPSASQHDAEHEPVACDASPHARSHTTQRTYRSARTHLPSASNTTAGAGETTDDPELPARPNSPNLTAAELIRREHARAIAAKMLREMNDRSDGRPRPRRLFAEASRPPTTRPQARPAPGASSNPREARTRGPRPLDPVSMARADMIAFNEAVARGDATSLMQSVTRQSEHRARCEPPASRPSDELLDDDEEILTQAEAYAKKKWPNSSPSSRTGNRKKKPLARDVSGIQRQVLVVAKLHLFAYALVEGIYQTRATFLRWAAAVYEATWQMELPTTPMVKPDTEMLEIMVNNIATMRGKTKERLRPFAANAAQFQQNVKNQSSIQENLRHFNLIYPNNFHCATYCPRSGHYENSEIGHCIAAALFGGPNSVGMMFPDYFQDMPLTVVAFALAIWQFCIEEWSNGWYESASLGAAAMRDKYEAQLAGLKDLRDVAPRRMALLQTKWRDYVAEYSGAGFEPSDENTIGGSLRSEMRPDTPEPELDVDAMSVEELEAQLFETARQQSLQEQTREIIAREEAADLGAPMDVDDGCEGTDDEQDEQNCAPAQEYNEHGVLTARSKGKGRAN